MSKESEIQMRLAVFDFDSTLMDGETLEFLAEQIGIKKEVKEVTDRAMRGELDFLKVCSIEFHYLKV